MPQAAAETTRSRLVTERQLAPKQWVRSEFDDDEPDPPATGPPPVARYFQVNKDQLDLLERTR